MFVIEFFDVVGECLVDDCRELVGVELSTTSVSSFTSGMFAVLFVRTNASVLIECGKQYSAIGLESPWLEDWLSVLLPCDAHTATV